MFGDLLQGMYARKMIKSRERTWMICYRVPSANKGDPELVLAVECTDAGEVVLPAVVHLVDIPEGT